MYTDVAIIGAGAVGCAVARELSRFQVTIAVCEKEADVSFGTTKANSGIVHSGLHSRPGTLMAGLCVRGSRLFPALAEELDVLYRPNGSVIVARNEEDLPQLDFLLEQGRLNGLSDLRRLGREELLALEPNLSPEIAGGLLAPGGGIVMPFDLAIALAENARANGARFFFNAPVGTVTRDRDLFHLQAGAVSLEARFVINAAGLGAAAAAGLIGDGSFTITPRKGEEYLLDRRLEGLVQRTIFPLPSAVSKGILVIPTVDGNIMLGPTAIPAESPDDLTTSAAGWQEIYANVRQLVPSLSPGDLIASFAGLRAAVPGGDFLVSPSPVDPHWVNAAGIESPGLTAAPALAELVRDRLAEAGLLLVPKADFDPGRRVIRFRLCSPAERDRLIRENPAYGRIVCRCELVTEAEVVAAIRAGATTLDGIKFRTRAGAGRCQGGFCTPRVLEIMARELGVPPTVLTKRGGESRILAGWTRPQLHEGGGRP